MSITSQGWILLLLVSLFSVGSDVLFIEAFVIIIIIVIIHPKQLTYNPL